MTRKDTILMAVMVNAGLLAILFATAIIYDTDKELEAPGTQQIIVEAKPSKREETRHIAAVSKSSVDEVDNVLKSYPRSSQTMVMDAQPDVFINEPPLIAAAAEEEMHVDSRPYPSGILGDYIEITVKKGDVLEKIAKSNRTTVSAIKKANQLQNERLQIGQVLKIPLKKETQVAEVSVPKVLPIVKEESSISEPQYYVIKSGDNPWKVAKQFNVKYEDILRLNDLDEEKARNLKVGDKIRVK